MSLLRAISVSKMMITRDFTSVFIALTVLFLATPSAGYPQHIPVAGEPCKASMADRTFTCHAQFDFPPVVGACFSTCRCTCQGNAVTAGMLCNKNCIVDDDLVRYVLSLVHPKTPRMMKIYYIVHH